MSYLTPFIACLQLVRPNHSRTTLLSTYQVSHRKKKQLFKIPSTRCHTPLQNLSLIYNQLCRMVNSAKSYKNTHILVVHSDPTIYLIA